MSTRSTITIINPDLTAKQAYCHWDGYLSYNGEVLLAAYNSPRKVTQLILPGDMSHLGFTSKPANLYKDGITMDTEYSKVFQPLDKLAKSAHLSVNKSCKLENEYNNLTSGYTFYFNRDRHEDSKANRPYTFKPASVKKSWDFAKKLSTHKTNLDKVYKFDSKQINCAVVPSEEYNYIYDASSAHPQWYVTYSKAVDYTPIYDTSAQGKRYECGVKGGHFILVFEPLKQAILNDTNIKNPAKDLHQMKHAYAEFIAHPYNPTYHQFMSDVRKKYMPAHSTGVMTINHKSHFINPKQMSLF